MTAPDEPERCVSCARPIARTEALIDAEGDAWCQDCIDAASAAMQRVIDAEFDRLHAERAAGRIAP